jgi:outer membrane protein OmpA-like peptidoglycan-associated protein
LIPGIYWLFNHWHRPTIHVPTVATGTANRLAPDFVQTPKTTAPQSVDIHFATGSSKLDKWSSAQLDEFVKTLGPNSVVNVTVSGYTDNIGNPANNMRLSQARADEVKTILIRKGVGSNRLSAQAFGEDSPIADNSTAAGRGNNRRVTVAVSGQ